MVANKHVLDVGVACKGKHKAFNLKEEVANQLIEESPLEQGPMNIAKTPLSLFLRSAFVALLANPSKGGASAFDVRGISIYNEPLLPPRRGCKMQELVLGVFFTRIDALPSFLLDSNVSLR
jgi:hypothetical protein